MDEGKWGSESVRPQDGHDKGGAAAGRGVAAYINVNNLANQEKFHGAQGHGFAAEEANTLHDRLHGLDARVVGNDNAKDGPDRLVNGQWIQAKYYQDGKQAIDACFRDGQFRYVGKNGEPMVIEVPKDDAIYQQAVERMRQRIAEGKVNGVTDPAEAENLVRPGSYTYQQAKNIAKAGNIDSLKFDATTGAITAASAFGVSAVITFGTSLWSGDEPAVAAKKAAFCGLKVGGTSFAVSVLSSQLLKAGLNSAMVGGTEAVARALGPKACAVIVNAFRSGSNIYGGAAMKSAARLLRGNVVVAGLTIVALSSLDVADIVRGRISPTQLAKNLAGTISSVAGGTGGWIGGAALGTMVFPGVGTVVGGLVGSLGVGVAASTLTNAVTGIFIKDDAEAMCSIIEDVVKRLAADNLMSKDEVDELVKQLNKKLDGGTLKDMYASKDRQAFVKRLADPLVDNIVAARKDIEGDVDEAIAEGLATVLSEVAEGSEGDGQDSPAA